MNRLLANTLTYLNVAVAIIIVAASTLFGTIALPVLGGLFGLIGGIILAALVCGTVAYIALIEKHLRKLASDGGMQTKTIRREPTI